VATVSATTKKASVPLSQRERQAVVNMAFLQILGVTESKGVGTRFELAFVATSELTTGRDTIQSAPVSYTIVGITPDNKTPIVYVPLVDVKELGLSNYSQAKLVASTQGQIPTIRKHVELLGFKTTSVADTVSQIERLFSGLRMVLGILGFVALIIAALGMFNTLTISLLERTHEVGMMKVIGMRSSEVQDLYLSESMIMGVLGGLCGLLIGFTTGKLLSVVLTALSVSKGYGVIDITFIPFLFIVLIMFLSVVVGLLTGIYPARRATKISALDALRYE
jgi:putative ABC transport system permease protein